jgi:hypothetical protein
MALYGPPKLWILDLQLSITKVIISLSISRAKIAVRRYTAFAVSRAFHRMAVIGRYLAPIGPAGEILTNRSVLITSWARWGAIGTR